MGEFTYLPYSIVLVCLEYLALVRATVWWTSRRDAGAGEAHPRPASSGSRLKWEPSAPHQLRWLGIFDQRSFLSCSCGLYGYTSSILLFCTRLTSCLFFVIIGMGFNFARSEVHGHWQFFTNWNLGLISGYYSLATAATSYYLLRLAAQDPTSMSRDGSGREGWLQLDSPRLRAAGTFLSVYFSIASVTALFVTIVNFVLLDPTPHFYNMVAHLFTSLSFFVEMALNSVQLRKNELVLNMSWVMLWLAFIWPVVWLGVKPEWPYDFMDSSTPVLFLWFQVLFIVYFLVFFGWYTLGTLKLEKFAHSSSVTVTRHHDHFDSSHESLIMTSEI